MSARNQVRCASRVLFPTSCCVREVGRNQAVPFAGPGLLPAWYWQHCKFSSGEYCLLFPLRQKHPLSVQSLMSAASGAAGVSKERWGSSMVLHQTGFDQATLARVTAEKATGAALEQAALPPRPAGQPLQRRFQGTEKDAGARRAMKAEGPWFTAGLRSWTRGARW